LIAAHCSFWFVLTLFAVCHRLGQFLSQLTKMAEEFNTAV
jgi:hypothetical protein